MKTLEVVGYLNSDFAGCVDSHKSTSGYIFILAGGAISWRSVKQTMTATSTMEAEFISCFEDQQMRRLHEEIVLILALVVRLAIQISGRYYLFHVSPIITLLSNENY